MNSPAAVAAGSHAQREEQATRPPLQRTRVGMISLGCAKNLVDAEIMIGSVLQRGMEITSRAEDADVLVINTCAFIDSAKEESIEAILEAHQQRGLNKRTNQKLIVSGCMSQRFSSELREALPEVDAFIGLDQVSQLGEIVEKIVAQVTNLRHFSLSRSPGTFLTTTRRASGSRRRTLPTLRLPKAVITPAVFA